MLDKVMIELSYNVLGVVLQVKAVPYSHALLTSSAHDGYFLPASNLIVVASDNENIDRVIKHEVTHFFIYHKIPVSYKIKMDEEFLCDFVSMYGEEILELSEMISEHIFNVQKSKQGV